MHLGNKTVNNLVEILVSLQKFYGWFYGGGFRTYHVGSVENEVTSPSCIQAGILAPPNNMMNATQKMALPTMTVCHQFDKLPPLNCRQYCHIWLAYTLEKTSASFLSAVWLS
jgi:hypothetical protein